MRTATLNPADPFAKLATEAACQDIACSVSGCTGVHKKPWYELLKPVVNPTLNVPDPVILMKKEGWMVEKFDELAVESNVYHYCPSIQWKKLMTIPEIRTGWCPDCHEDVPVEIVGAFTLHNWKSLQQYDRDMKKYGMHNGGEVTVDTDIKVYR